MNTKPDPTKARRSAQLNKAQDEVDRADAARARAIDKRNKLIRDAAIKGETGYSIARMLGMRMSEVMIYRILRD